MGIQVKIAGQIEASNGGQITLSDWLTSHSPDVNNEDSRFKQSDKKDLTLKTSTFISLNIIAARTKSSKSTGISGLQYKTSFGPVEMF